MNYSCVVNDSTAPSTQNVNTSKKQTVSTSFSQIYSDTVAEKSGGQAASPTGLGFLGEKLLLPNAQTLGELSSGLKNSLDELFSENGISNDPPVELAYNYNTNEVEVSGDRDDTDQISQLINNDPELKEQTRTLLAIASHYAAMQESFQFTKEYMNSDNPEAVVAKYSDLFDGTRKYPEVSYLFGAESALQSDGEAMSLSGADGEDSESGDAAQVTESDVKVIFAEIKHLLLMNYINKNPEDDEDEQAKGASGGGGTADKAAKTEEDDTAAQYSRLMRQMAAAREDAVSKYGSDKNKYALAIESYSSAQHKAETEAQNSGDDSGKEDKGKTAAVSGESA